MTIEQEMTQNREDRALQHGPGQQLKDQVHSRQDIKDDDEGRKYYRRKGISTLGNFEVRHMYQEGFDPIANENDESIVPNKYLTKDRVVFGRNVEGRKVDNDPNDPTAWGAFARVPIGAGHDLIKGTARLGTDFLPDDSKVKQAIESYQDPKWLEDTTGMPEDIARGLAQFATGYGAVVRSLGGMGIKSLLAKDMVASVMAGQTFDPAEGNLATMVREFGLESDFLRMLDSKLTTEEEGKLRGRLAMAMEEMGIGTGATAIRMAARGVKSVRMRYRDYGDQMINDGVKNYFNATGSLNHPTQGMRGDAITHQDHAAIALEQIATGYQIKEATVEEFMEMAKVSGIDENAAKKGWNAAAKSKIENIQKFLTPAPAPGPIARQKGNVSLFEGGTVSSAATPTDYASLEKYFDKQIVRGNLQKSEYEEAIKPAIQAAKDSGTSAVSPQ